MICERVHVNPRAAARFLGSNLLPGTKMCEQSVDRHTYKFFPNLLSAHFHAKLFTCGMYKLYVSFEIHCIVLYCIVLYNNPR